MLILASGSPRRKELLRASGLNFEVRTFDVDESSVVEKDGAALSYKLACLKAKTAAQRLTEEKYGDFTVLGADTVVEKDYKIYGKPKDASDALRMLKELCGGEHEVYTSVCLIASDNTFAARTVKTKVEFGAFDEARLTVYVRSGKSFGKAGAYGLQDEELKFLIKDIDGDRDSVIGLPTGAVLEMLKEKAKWRQWK